MWKQVLLFCGIDIQDLVWTVGYGLHAVQRILTELYSVIVTEADTFILRRISNYACHTARVESSEAEDVPSRHLRKWDIYGLLTYYIRRVTKQKVRTCVSFEVVEQSYKHAARDGGCNCGSCFDVGLLYKSRYNAIDRNTLLFWLLTLRLILKQTLCKWSIHPCLVNWMRERLAT